MSRTDWKRWYATLRAADPVAYKKAIENAEGISISYRLRQDVAAEMERSFVVFACELLGVEP